MVHGELAEVGARHRHKECRRHTLARDVRHDEPDLPVRQLDEVVEIPAHGSGRDHSRRAVAPRLRRKLRRQDRYLQRPRDVELGLELRLRLYQGVVALGEFVGTFRDDFFEDATL